MLKETTNEFRENNLRPIDGLHTGIRIPKVRRSIQWQLQVISFSCRINIYISFAQLTYRESLRDIQACLRATQSRLYHLGIRGTVSRNTNQNRNWQIYADFAQVLIARARKLYAADSFGIELEQAAYALDSTTIELCLALFPWAEFRKHKGVVKLHTLLDLHGNIPSIIIVTSGKVHDVQYPRSIDFRGRGRLYHGSQLSRFRSPFQNASNISILCDENKKQLQPQAPLTKNNKTLIFLTNNFVLPAITIAELYRCRRQVELLFKWIKQHFRIKAFYGTTEMLC